MRDICFLGIKVQGMYCGKHVFKVEFFRPEKTSIQPLLQSPLVRIFLKTNLGYRKV